MYNPTSRQYWEDLSREAWVNLGNPTPSPADLRFDAFRHAYTSALWAFNFGETMAKVGGDYIESSNPRNFDGTDFMERDMRGDLLNNARGREIGQDHSGGTSPSLSERVRDALDRGELVVDKQTDTRTLSQNFPSDLYPLTRNGLPGTMEAEGWSIDVLTNTQYTAAKNWQPPRDPLVLDLDGDGIETVGIFGAAGAGASSSPILFDHDADSIRTGTGWIKADDALLVRDINGNGTIDSGRELFGDNTLLPNNTRASNGFTALAQHDTNADGQINSQDAIYSQLKIWRDLNQDGTSQAGELQTLAQAGIASIGVQGTATNTNLVDSRGQATGNTQIASGSFTRTDGGTGASGVAELSGSLLLGSNNFYREFTYNSSISTAAQGLLNKSNLNGEIYKRRRLKKLRLVAKISATSSRSSSNSLVEFLNCIHRINRLKSHPSLQGV
jgi:hypothetical protein